MIENFEELKLKYCKDIDLPDYMIESFIKEFIRYDHNFWSYSFTSMCTYTKSGCDSCPLYDKYPEFRCNDSGKFVQYIKNRYGI